MRKRKGRKADKIGENGEERKGSGFFACYLLTSLSPRFKGRTYIGYTLNPRRRIRQHNGEIGSGAWRTKMKRPWEMVLCIYGFPSHVAALQFEWAWQHPVESLAVRKVAASFKSLSGLTNKIKMAYTMLTLPPWQSLNLTVNLFSTKYKQYTSVCPALPQQMRVQVRSMDELPCYNDDARINDEWDAIECDEEDRESTGDFEESFNQQTGDVGLQSASSNIADERESPGLVELFDEPLNERRAVVVTDKYQPLIKSPDIGVPEVEIVDTVTPSPCLGMAGSKGKNRREPNQWPEVVDLTNSPIYV